MRVQSFQSHSNSTSQLTFKGIHVTDPDVQKLLLTRLNPKQLGELSGLLKEQEDNSVHVFIDSKNGKRLEASMFCEYRIQDFKTEYKQRPFFESKLNFIKRVVGIANEYKKQIKDFEQSKLNWNYSVWQAWKNLYK